MISPNPVDFRSLDAALVHMARNASELDRAAQDATFPERVLANPLALRQWNDRLQLAERAFLFLQGIPGREWYRHMVWCTSLYDGAFVFFAVSPVRTVVFSLDCSLSPKGTAAQHSARLRTRSSSRTGRRRRSRSASSPSSSSSSPPSCNSRNKRSCALQCVQ